MSVHTPSRRSAEKKRTNDSARDSFISPTERRTSREKTVGTKQYPQLYGASVRAFFSPRCQLILYNYATKMPLASVPRATVPLLCAGASISRAGVLVFFLFHPCLSYSAQKASAGKRPSGDLLLRLGGVFPLRSIKSSSSCFIATNVFRLTPACAGFGFEPFARLTALFL